MATDHEIEMAEQTIRTELHESGYTEAEVKQIVEVIHEEYNGLPFGWIDLVDIFIEHGRTQEEALNIVYLSFKAVRHRG